MSLRTDDPDDTGLATLAGRHPWGNFTPLVEHGPVRPIVARGSGANVEDIEGRRYLDGCTLRCADDIDDRIEMEGADVPLGGVLVSDRVAAPFLDGDRTFLHGLTFAGHPVALGLLRRTDDRGDPVIMLAPPLISGPEEFERIAATVRVVLDEAWIAHRSRR